MKNHPSADSHADFVDTAIADLLVTQAIAELQQPPTVVSPLGVVPKKGTDKYRLVWDGRYVNSHLVIPTFSYETLAVLPDWARLGDWVFTIDLKSGFHHVDLHPDFWHYMGFSWKGKFYCFTAMPFGLGPAPWCYTVLMQAVLSHFRQSGHRVSGYLDDSIWFHASLLGAAELRCLVLRTFDALGLVVNFPKSHLDIVHCCPYLGMIADFARGVYTVPASKKENLVSLIRAVLQRSSSVSVRELARIKGKLISMSWAFGLAVSFFTKSMDKDIAAAQSWQSSVSISQTTAQELQFWLDNFDVFDGSKPMWRSSKIDYVVHVDAAGRSAAAAGGWGAWMTVDGVKHTARGVWQSSAESVLSSTFQELQACLLALQSFHRSVPAGHGQFFQGKSVQLVTDSNNAFLALSRGRVYAADSVRVTQQVFLFCFEHSIDLSVVWVPREDNCEADALSKCVDSEDVMICPAVFNELSRRWGPFTVDLFASSASKLLPKYYSAVSTPDTAGVDAFAFLWDGMSWAHPPFRLISRVWQHAAECGARICLLVPVWRNKPWWQLIVPDGGSKFAAVVHDFNLLSPAVGLFMDVSADGIARPKPKYNWHSIALLLDFHSPLADSDRIVTPEF
jgi:ribonuclease HI